MSDNFFGFGLDNLFPNDLKSGLFLPFFSSPWFHVRLHVVWLLIENLG